MATQPDFAGVGSPIPFQRSTPPETPTIAALLQFEGELRRQPTLPELIYYIANETRRIVGYDQLFILRQPRIGETLRVEAISSIGTVDRNAPLVHAIEQAMKHADLATAASLDVLALSGDQLVAFDDYPFHEFFWHPLKDRDESVFAGLLLARQAQLDEAEAVRLGRVADTAAHAWCALLGNRPVRRVSKIGPRERKGLALIAACIALFPVQMTALAPVEVVARHPFVVSAPFSGVISSIDVPPNAPVRKGQLLMRFDDMKFRNEQSVAAQKAQVAVARVERSTTASFAKADEAHDIGIEQAEAQVASADLNYARDMMAKTQIAAPRDGIIIYSDRKDWEGRAVNVGEPIMQVADPRDVSFHIDLPAKSQMELVPGSRVRVWLDSQPFWAIDGRLETASYQARETPGGVLAFAVTAKPLGESPRIGSRGTAEVRGNWAPFVYTLLKRPISSFRQFIGF
jgi:multidrug resistance efflux pump